MAIICEGVKGFFYPSVPGAVLMCVHGRHYHYQQRDEIVNVHAGSDQEDLLEVNGPGGGVV